MQTNLENLQDRFKHMLRDILFEFENSPYFSLGLKDLIKELNDLYIQGIIAQTKEERIV